MQKPDTHRTASLREALGDVRENLFLVAEAANEMEFQNGDLDVNTLLQSANYNLGEAERKLTPA